MTASIILKKIILGPIKWYFNKVGNSIRYVSVTGTFPPIYYEMIMKEREKESADERR